MKWLILQSAGHHDGTDGWTKNDHMRECFAIKYALEQNGQVCDIWGKRHINYFNAPDYNTYDYVLLLENYEMDWVPALSAMTKPIKLQWIIDLHCNGEQYVQFSHQCDIILHSTKSLIPAYQQLVPTKRHIWFPNGVDSLNIPYYQKPKEYDVLFVGSLLNRGSLLYHLNIPHIFATGQDMIDNIAKTRVHFNKPISVDLNYRNFETIGIGTCLLTQDLPELRELGFKDTENCLLYSTLDDCRQKLRYALTDDNYIRIAKGGYEFSKTQTYVKRVEQLLKDLAIK